MAKPIELIERRTRTSKTHHLGGNRYSVDVDTSSIHYRDDPDNAAELYKEIDPNIQPSSRADWDWEVTKGHWHLLIKEDTTIALGKDGHWIGFRLDGLAYLDAVTKEYHILQQRQTVTPVVSDNKIRWEGIFDGANLEYIYGNDGFKENIELTQQARDWCKNHPPSDYGLSDEDSFLVFYMKCDWKNTYPAEDESGEAIDWEADNEFEDKGIFFRHPVKNYLVSALPLSYARHKDSDTMSCPLIGTGECPRGISCSRGAGSCTKWFNSNLQAPIRKRFFKKGDNYWLLFGSNVKRLNQILEGTIIFDPSVDEQVGASSDDAGTGGANCGAWALTLASLGFGQCCGENIEDTGLRFQTLNVPNGATIDTAYCTLYAVGSCNPTAALLKIRGEDTDDATTFSTLADFNGRSRTSASVNWTPSAWTADNWYNTDEIKTIIQEIVNRGGWAANNDLVIFIEDNGSTTDSVRCYSWDYDDHSKAPKLHIEYTAVTEKTSSDTGSGAEGVPLPSAILAGSENGSGIEALVARLLAAVDTGYGVEVVVEVGGLLKNLFAAELGQGSDSLIAKIEMPTKGGGMKLWT